MPVAKLTLEIDIPHAQSLKDRRQVVRSVRDSLRRGFNVSAAEMDEAPVWNRATLGIVAISRSATYLIGQMQEAEDAARRACTRFGAEILDAYMELLAVNDDPAVFTADEQRTAMLSLDQTAQPGSAANSDTVIPLDKSNA